MGFLDGIGSMINFWLVCMAIGIPIIIIRSLIDSKKMKDDLKEINRGLDLFDDMHMNSGACFSCIYRNGDHTKVNLNNIVYCSRLNKNVNCEEEDFSKEHPCPYFEGDPDLLAKRR